MRRIRGGFMRLSKSPSGKTMSMDYHECDDHDSADNPSCTILSGYISYHISILQGSDLEVKL